MHYLDIYIHIHAVIQKAQVSQYIHINKTTKPLVRLGSHTNGIDERTYYKVLVLYRRGKE